MEKIQAFAKKYTIVYGILAEVIVLGGMMLAGLLFDILFRETGIDTYVLQALGEIVGAGLAFAR